MSPTQSQTSPLSPKTGFHREAGMAVSKARRVFEGWRALSFGERASLLEKVQRGLAREPESWAAWVAEENGKPVLEALGADVFGSLEALRVLLREGERWVSAQKIPVTLFDWMRGVRGRQIVYEPIGLIGIIGTWNYPLLINLQQIAGALLCGNVVVWKPSEFSPNVAGRVEQLFRKAGFPEGVFTVFPGDGQMGEALIRAGCDKILFTGHGQTGRRILSLLAEQGVPAILELSGMDAALVCKDADLAHAVRALTWGSMTNSGQSCSASRRLIIHQAVFDRFSADLIEAVRALRVGDPTDPATEIGPLRTKEQAQRLGELIEDAVSKGARL